MREPILVAVFAREPVGRIELARTDGADVALAVGDLRLKFKAGRRHLLLDSLGS